MAAADSDRADTDLAAVSAVDSAHRAVQVVCTAAESIASADGQWTAELAESVAEQSAERDAVHRADSSAELAEVQRVDPLAAQVTAWADTVEVSAESASDIRAERDVPRPETADQLALLVQRKPYSAQNSVELA